MYVNLTSKQIEKIETFLKTSYGFKKNVTTDKKGYWLEKSIRHPFISHLRIVYDIQMNRIFVMCLDLDINEYASIYESKYSKSKMIKIIESFSKSK